MRVVRLYACLQDNVGDDLMVETLLKRYPNVMFFFDTPSNPSLGERFNCYPNFMNLDLLFRKWRHINHFFNMITLNRKRNYFNWKALSIFERRIICSVYIGGSLYQQHSGVSVEKEEQKLHYGPLFIIGANFGPFQNTQFLSAFHDYFHRCTHVCFRDRKSYGLFSDLDNVSWAPDVVFNIDVPPRSSQPNKVLISVIDFKIRKHLDCNVQDYIDFISHCCSSAVQDGLIPVLVSFCKYEGDENMVNCIMEALPLSVKEKTEKYMYGTTKKLFELFAESQFVIATRFHAMILALQFHIPFFCVAYNEKIINVLNDLGIESWCSLKELPTAEVDQLWHDIPDVPDISDYRNKAAKQFEALDRFLMC